MSERYNQLEQDFNDALKYGIPIRFWDYLGDNSSLGEIDMMFCFHRDEQTLNPCCPRHSGSLPVSVNSMEKTPCVQGEKCTHGKNRQAMRMLTRAFIKKSTGQEPTDLKDPHPDNSYEEFWENSTVTVN
jgi:hypothetical protein